ncbi:hypothetical protein [Methylomonas methanica]|nr:hypothetical protein [Methylomonas methanica]
MNMLKSIVSAVTMTLICATAVAAPAEINKIFSKLPSITQYERTCLLSSATAAELKACIANMPNTEYYSRVRAKSLGRLDQLNIIAADLNTSPDLTPMEKFCLFSSTPACMDACIQGWVCP